MDSKLTQALQAAVGADNVITPDDARYFAFTFGDATMYRSNPDGVVFPASAEQVAKVINIARQAGTFITPAGGLTGLSGGAVSQGGVQLNLARMNKVLSIDTVSKTVVAEPGVSCFDLNAALAKVGMIMPVAPASHQISTLGANIAECAGGTWGMSKGNFRNYLLALEVVDGTGNVFETGGHLVVGQAVVSHLFMPAELLPHVDALDRMFERGRAVVGNVEHPPELDRSAGGVGVLRRLRDRRAGVGPVGDVPAERLAAAEPIAKRVLGPVLLGRTIAAGPGIHPENAADQKHPQQKPALPFQHARILSRHRLKLSTKPV